MSPAVHTDTVPVDGVSRISLVADAFRPNTKAESDVLVERSKQRLKHGHVRDDGLQPFTLVRVAESYLDAARMLDDCVADDMAVMICFAALSLPPRSLEPASLGSPRDCLVRAAALLIAEIDRLDRAALDILPKTKTEG